MPASFAPDFRTPFDPGADGDKLHEECGIFGVLGAKDAAQFVALGLHALQHRGQEAGESSPMTRMKPASTRCVASVMSAIISPAPM